MVNLSDDLQAEIIPINTSTEEQTIECKDNDVLPTLPMRDNILFPRVIIPVNVGRKKSLRAVREVYQKAGELLTVTQIDPRVEDPNISDFYEYGTIIVAILSVIYTTYCFCRFLTVYHILAISVPLNIMSLIYMF